MVKFMAGFLAGIVTVFIFVFAMGNQAVYKDRMVVSATPVPVVKKQQQRQQTVPAVQDTVPAAVAKTNNNASLTVEPMTYIPAVYRVETAMTISNVTVFPPSIATNQPVSTHIPLVTVSPLPSAALIGEDIDYLASVFSLLVESDVAFDALNKQLEDAVKDGAVIRSDGWKLRTTEAIGSVRDANESLRALPVPERFANVSIDLIMMATYLDAAMDQLSANIGDVSVNYSDTEKDEHTNSLGAADEARQRALEKIRTMQVAE